MKIRKKSLCSGTIVFLSVFLLFLVFTVKPVKAYSNTTIISVKGKTFYLVEQSSRTQYKNITKLYQKTNYGNKLVASINYSGNAGITYSLNYGNKIFCRKKNVKIKCIFVLKNQGFITTHIPIRLVKKDFEKKEMALSL